MLQIQNTRMRQILYNRQFPVFVIFILKHFLDCYYFICFYAESLVKLNLLTYFKYYSECALANYFLTLVSELKLLKEIYLFFANGLDNFLFLFFMLLHTFFTLILLLLISLTRQHHTYLLFLVFPLKLI